MKMKVGLIIHILEDAITMCTSTTIINESVAGQLLAYKTELEVYYRDQDEMISLPETIINLLVKSSELV